MSNVSIYEKKWIDLVFEGKNKSYGAYQLRQENARTTLFSFFGGVLFLFLVSGVGILFSSFSSETITPPAVPVLPPIKVIDVVIEPKVKPKQQQQQTQKPNPVEPKNLSNLVVVEKTKAEDVVPKNSDITNEATPEVGTPGGTGLDTTPTVPGSDDSTPGIDTNPKPTVLLDKLPEFPGGMNKFYQYVGTNFERPTLDESAVITVIVSFVIEIDGSITDIKILKNPGYGMDKEAIRVLKSLKTKWTPGILNGQKVRTLYTLPIKVKSE